MTHIEMDVDDDFEFFCPRTGTAILGPEHFEPSAATAFYFVPEAPDFQLLNDALVGKLKPLLDAEDQVDEEDISMTCDVFERFSRAVLTDHPNLVLFSFTSHGMACGPVSSTLHICIDFAHGCEEPD